MGASELALNYYELAPGDSVAYGYHRHERQERVVAFALGAPRDSGDTEIRRQCDDCGERTHHTVERADDGDTLARCLECDSVTGRFE